MQVIIPFLKLNTTNLQKTAIKTLKPNLSFHFNSMHIFKKLSKLLSTLCIRNSVKNGLKILIDIFLL